MKRGDRVRVVRLVSLRGTKWSSLRPEYYAKSVGRIDSVGLVADWIVSVKFHGVTGTLDVPKDLLELVS